MAVDSGATESVVSKDTLTCVQTKEGEAYKRGVTYEIADGTTIPNEGEKEFIAVAEDYTERTMRVQVCDVNKSLLSVKKCVRAGNRVVFSDEEEGSYIEDKMTGERLYMRESCGGMYTLKFWVKKSF